MRQLLLIILIAIILVIVTLGVISSILSAFGPESTGAHYESYKPVKIDGKPIPTTWNPQGNVLGPTSNQ